jgi:small subunit ribosomal protein S1
VRDVTPLMNIPQPFADPQDGPPRGNIVVSRRAVLEEIPRRTACGNRRSSWPKAKSVEGVVKNITDYGAFVDLGGIDGLLHVTDMAGAASTIRREVVEVGQTVKVQIIKINQETQRISLGMKQLQSDPWDGMAPSTRSAAASPAA